MAKQNMKKSEAQNEAEETKGTATGAVDPKVLWDEVRSFEGKFAQVQLQMDDLTVERSKTLKAIVDSQGTGPFQIAGLGIVTIRSRKSKVDGKDPVYFTVAMGSRKITVID